MVTVNFILNGKPVSAEADGLTLLKYLRGVACLKGAKEGCSTGHCGACTVLLDGKPVRSCVTRMDKLEGKSVVTIEALHGADGGLHPIQQAFLDIGAVQCGFCTPGMVLATKALLDVNPDPTDEEICEALKNNYCRCTGYVKIIEAVHLAAARLRGEDPSVDDMRTWENLEIVKYEGEDDVTAQDLTGRHIGRCAIDIDGPAKVTGALPFTCDRADADTLYGAFVWSQHSRAKILSMDFSAVESAAGVVRVLTHKDVPGRNSYATFNPEQPVFCDTEVNFLGDMLALVVADTEAHARAAAKLARVEYEPLPGVFEIEDSYTLGGRQIIRTIDFSSGDLAAAEKTPGLQTFEGDYYFERQEHAYIEPECAIGEYDESTGVVRVTTCSRRSWICPPSASA